jgi:hypothetical protein
MGHVLEGQAKWEKGRKKFFFKKKNQKNFAPLRAVVLRSRG